MFAEQLDERTVMSGDAALFMRTIGGYEGGPTLVILHGGPGISHEYTLGLGHLADTNLRVVFYDQRQVGRSTGIAASSEPLEEWAKDLEAVRQAIGVERIHLLGHSAGGFPAIAYGSRYPEHTASIIFVDSVSPLASVLSQAMGRMMARAAELQAAGKIPEFSPPTPEDGTAFLAAGAPIIHFVRPHRPSSLNGATYRPIVGDHIMQALGNYDLREAVSRLTMPTLSYISEIPFGTEMADSLYQALPKENAQRFMLPDCGHIPWVECPESFFARIRAFLNPFIEDHL